MVEKKKYVVHRVVNSPKNEITWDVSLAHQEGFEFVAEFTKKRDANLFAKVANAKLSGRRICT